MSRKPAYQPDETSARLAALTLLGVLALVPLSGALVWGMFRAVAAVQSLPPAAPPAPTHGVAPGPRLQAAPILERLAFERRARAALDGYGWVDHRAGVARIPIDRAMALQAAQGWPDAGALR